ncbi:hypothetical protein CW676_11710 [Macrococcoides caseolyticum]|uniref:hypothetical protein n=1 Tax=Macrococcoides caseolyticum TaxID=69966 RepID=UPI000C32FC6A|nr:hypothetical protein [Macrococcus caseolyticus]PKE51943.1 hypothetical protein CW676_11710 [Macrococcus caseolyticus]PKF37489.1 hypothetical protein CW681_11810 [Macrococcus caseolyticus]
MINQKQLGTFILNKKEPIHRWYKYDEGYSSAFIYKEINALPFPPKTLFEPFAGSGTTPLVASSLGIKSFYTEMNPFMRFVTNTKINIARNTVPKKNDVIKNLQNLTNKINETNLFSKTEIKIGGFEKFYSPEVLSDVIFIKNEINKIKDNDSKNLAQLALASISVKISKMKKHGDLRYAKPHEKKPEDFDVKFNYINKIQQIIEDISLLENDQYEQAICVGSDAREATLPIEVDCIITSPPYLNGTNYIRNTKLELNILDFVTNESELKELHSEGIISGINNVSNRREIVNNIDELIPILEKLEPVAYDKRITKMVIGYFNDMNDFFENSKKILKHEGVLILDIGDSQFAGVHIPTDILLTKIAEKHGFILYEEEILRTRRSKNNMILSQKVLRYKLNKEGELQFDEI